MYQERNEIFIKKLNCFINFFCIASSGFDLLTRWSSYRLLFARLFMISSGKNLGLNICDLRTIWWTNKSWYSYNWYFKNCSNSNLLCVCARSLKVQYINDHSKVGPTTTNDAWCELIFWQWGQRIFILLHRYLHYYVVGRPDQLFFLQFIFSCLQFTCTWSSS